MHPDPDLTCMPSGFSGVCFLCGSLSESHIRAKAKQSSNEKLMGEGAWIKGRENNRFHSTSRDLWNTPSSRVWLTRDVCVMSMITANMWNNHSRSQSSSCFMRSQRRICCRGWGNHVNDLESPPGPIVWRPISANLWLNLIRVSFCFQSKAWDNFLYFFKFIQSSYCRQKELNWFYLLTFHISIQISH